MRKTNTTTTVKHGRQERTEPRKRLQLRRRTVADLTEPQLEGVVGAHECPTEPPTCRGPTCGHSCTGSCRNCQETIDYGENCPQTLCCDTRTA